jgi:hypothetical protein
VYDAPFPSDDGVAPTPSAAALSSGALNPADLHNVTLSNGNQTALNAGTNSNVRSTISHATGKWHVEFSNDVETSDGSNTFGFVTATYPIDSSDYIGVDMNGFGLAGATLGLPALVYFNVNAVFTFPQGVAISAGDTFAVEIDFDAQQMWFQNATSGPANWNGNDAANPATGTGGISISDWVTAATPYFVAVNPYTDTNQISVNFSSGFMINPSAGFSAWDADMSNGSPPITPAPVPPSIPGIVQPVIVTGGQSLPPSFPLGSVGSWLPPPQVGMGGDAPFGTPVVPPGSGLPGVVQPQYATGSANLPTAASLFPSGTTSPPYPPIVFANVMMIGAGAPPSTPTTPVIPTLAGEDDEPGALPDPDPDPEPAPHRRPARKRH